MGNAKPTDPQGWMAHLEAKLNRETARTDQYANYYANEPKALAFAQEKFADTFGDLFVGWQDNFCGLIVDSISERLSIKGFRMLDDDKKAETFDKEAEQVWQRNFLDADSNAAHIDALVRGNSYIVVWGTEDGQPIVTPEPANQVAVQYTPGSRRQLDAALKRYYDDWGTEFSTLWLPDTVYTAEKGPDGRWQVHEDSERNPLGVVPVVPLSNRSRLLTTGVGKDMLPPSELKAILPIQDAINKVSADALVASEFAAFPQRIITGLEFDDEDDEREALLRAYIDRILAPEGDDISWGQFDPADLSNYVKLIDMLVQHMASISRVPFHYFLINGGQAPSGESITAAEAGLVAKARERMLHFGESWETAMRLAFKVKGDEARANAWGAEVIWGDPEHRSKSALADYLVKLVDLDVPKRQLQEDAGYTPVQIGRFKAMRDEEHKEDMERQKDLAKITPPTVGPGAPAGQPNAKQPAKSASAERQKAKARAA